MGLCPYSLEQIRKDPVLHAGANLRGVSRYPIVVRNRTGNFRGRIGGLERGNLTILESITRLLVKRPAFGPVWKRVRRCLVDNRMFLTDLTKTGIYYASTCGVLLVAANYYIPDVDNKYRRGGA